MAKKYVSVGTLQFRRTAHPAGSIVEIADAAEVKRLLGLKAIAPIGGAPVAEEIDLSESVKKIEKQVAVCADRNLLKAAEQSELENDPPRKGVLEAIATRLSELDAESDDE